MSTEVQTYLDSLPDDVKRIDLSNKNLTELPDLSRFTKLQYLECPDNKLRYLPKFNETLIEIYCDNNMLLVIPELNPSLKLLYCSDNCLSDLPDFNENIVEVYCQNNLIISLPMLRPDFHVNLLHVEYTNNPIYNNLLGKKQFDDTLEIIRKNYHDSYDI
jgi:Leucine-rich repeat (LRR) protein